MAFNSFQGSPSTFSPSFVNAQTNSTFIDIERDTDSGRGAFAPLRNVSTFDGANLSPIHSRSSSSVSTKSSGVSRLAPVHETYVRCSANVRVPGSKVSYNASISSEISKENACSLPIVANNRTEPIDSLPSCSSKENVSKSASQHNLVHSVVRNTNKNNTSIVYWDKIDEILDYDSWKKLRKLALDLRKEVDLILTDNNCLSMSEYCFQFLCYS